jgi:hypothetical protein
VADFRLLLEDADIQAVLVDEAIGALDDVDTAVIGDARRDQRDVPLRVAQARLDPSG